MSKFTRSAILALGLAPTINLALVTTAKSQEEPKNTTIALPANQLICSLESAYGVFRGSSFIPDPQKHGYSLTPKILKLPDSDNRIFREKRGWVLWIENPTEENYFSPTSHAFDEANFEWFLTYTYFDKKGPPVSISLKRVCAELRDIVPSH